jgi:ribosome maturation factor RimP
MSTADAIERAVAPVARSVGLEVIDVELGPRNLRVTVDRPGGVDLDTIATATTAISRVLDYASGVPSGPYELEVSSPGLEQRLRRPEHFSRHLGERVAIKTKPGVEGERRVEGVLAEAGPERLRVVSDGHEPAGREIAYSEIERARTVFDWRAELAGTPAPSARRARKAARRERLRQVPPGTAREAEGR